MDSRGFQAWIVSLTLHSLVLGAVLMMPFERRIVRPDPFRWEVLMVPLAQPPESGQPSVPRHTRTPPRPIEPLQKALPRTRQERPVVTTEQPVVRAVERRPHVVREMHEQTVETNERAVAPIERIVQTSGPVQARAARVISQAAPADDHIAKAVSRGTVVTAASVVGLQEEATAVKPTVEQSLPHTTSRTERQDHPIDSHRAAVIEPIIERVPTANNQGETQTLPVGEAPSPRAHYGWLKQSLAEQIERVKRYPQFAVDNNWEGRVVVRAVIWNDGSLTDLAVIESSGHELLDHESLELLKRISPVYLKHPLGHDSVTLKIPISYGIR